MKTICTASTAATAAVVASVLEIPKMGSKVVTTMGEGKVVGINRKERTAAVQLSPDNTIQVEWEELVDASQADNV